MNLNCSFSTNKSSMRKSASIWNAVRNTWGLAAISGTACEHEECHRSFGLSQQHCQLCLHADAWVFSYCTTTTANQVRRCEIILTLKYRLKHHSVNMPTNEHIISSQSPGKHDEYHKHTSQTHLVQRAKEITQLRTPKLSKKQNKNIILKMPSSTGPRPPRGTST